MPSILPVSPVVINVPRVFLFPVCYGILYLDLNTIGFLAFQTRLFSLVLCCFIYLYLRLKQSKYSDLELNTWRLYYHDWAVFNFHFLLASHWLVSCYGEGTLIFKGFLCHLFTQGSTWEYFHPWYYIVVLWFFIVVFCLRSINSDCLVQLRASSYIWNLNKFYLVTKTNGILNPYLLIQKPGIIFRHSSRFNVENNF